jgi:hypothetical protein
MAKFSSFRCGNIQSPLINSQATLVLVWSRHESLSEKTLIQSTNSHFSTLMQLLFSFDRSMRVEKTFMQTLASQLSCNSCSRLIAIEAWESRKLSYKLSLINSHQLSSNSCYRLIEAWELRKLSCQLSLINSHATLVLVWSKHESWENFHANSHLSTLMQLLFSFDRSMRVEKTFMQTLAYQLSSTLMQLLFSFDRGMRVEKTLVQTLACQLSFSFDQGLGHKSIHVFSISVSIIHIGQYI